VIVKLFLLALESLRHVWLKSDLRVPRLFSHVSLVPKCLEDYRIYFLT
jgi:hypothetical protein